MANNPDVSLTLTSASFDAITLKQRTFADSIQSGDIKLGGDPAKLRELFGMFDEFTTGFEIVEPLKVRVE